MITLKNVLDVAAEAYDPDLKATYDETGKINHKAMIQFAQGDTLGEFVIFEIKSLIGHIEGQVYQDDAQEVVRAFDTAIDQLSTVRRKLAALAINLPRE